MILSDRRSGLMCLDCGSGGPGSSPLAGAEKNFEITLQPSYQAQICTRNWTDFKTLCYSAATVYISFIQTFKRKWVTCKNLFKISKLFRSCKSTLDEFTVNYLKEETIRRQPD